MYAYAICRRTTKFDVITHTGKWLVSSLIHALSQGDNVQALQTFGSSRLFMGTPFLTKRGNTCWGWTCILGQPRLPSQES